MTSSYVGGASELLTSCSCGVGGVSTDSAGGFSVMMGADCVSEDICAAISGSGCMAGSCSSGNSKPSQRNHQQLIVIGQIKIQEHTIINRSIKYIHGHYYK